MTEYYSIQSSQDVIQHFGIKGMKWGQRRTKEFYTNKYIGNWDRVAAEHLAVKQRNEAIRKDFERIRNKSMDKKLDDLHKRGDSVKDLFRQRANEAKKLSSELNNSSKQLVDTTNRTRMNAKEANEMLSRIKKRNEDFLKNYK